MSKVVAEISTSLDGYVAGPNVRLDNGMGDGGEALHDWMFAKEGGWAAVEQQLAVTGAFVMGRTMLDVGLEPWGDEPPFHAPSSWSLIAPPSPSTRPAGRRSRS